MLNDSLLALLAFSPIVLAAVLLVGLQWPAKRAMPLAFILTVLVALKLPYRNLMVRKRLIALTVIPNCCANKTRPHKFARHYFALAVSNCSNALWTAHESAFT